jgi:hypothetical protein
LQNVKVGGVMRGSSRKEEEGERMLASEGAAEKKEKEKGC